MRTVTVEDHLHVGDAGPCSCRCGTEARADALPAATDCTHRLAAAVKVIAPPGLADHPAGRSTHERRSPHPEPALQRQPAEARRVRRQCQQWLRRDDGAGPSRDDLAEQPRHRHHRGSGRLRGVGPGGALEGLRRRHQFQRHLLRYPGLGCRHGRGDRTMPRSSARPMCRRSTRLSPPSSAPRSIT